VKSAESVVSISEFRLKTANLAKNVVPKRFGTFISIHLRDTYIFAVSKIGLTVGFDPWEAHSLAGTMTQHIKKM